MRLIDADAFKEYIKEFEDDYENAYIICEYIDNAPTVVKDYDREYDEGFNAGYAEAIKNIPEYRKLANKLQRPQGEWIIVKDKRYGDNVKCPFCEKELAGTDLNFCCKCGAKLIGSEKMNGSKEE